MIKFKNMKESQKELIRELARVSHWSYEAKLKQEFPELFEANLEVGKWYRYNGCLINYCGRNGHLLIGYGIGVDSNWVTKGYMGSSPEMWVQATKKEVEEALIKEAKRRGVWNTPIKCLLSTINWDDHPIYDECFYEANNRLCSKQGVVFQDGKWAEPLHKELTLDQIEKELGYKVKIVKE